MNNPWSAKERDLLRQFAAQGLSARQIAEALKIRTRNAVIGQCRRDGIKLHHVPLHLPKKPKQHAPVRLIDLKEHHCRWPIDGPGYGFDRLSCGAPKVGKEVYCPKHCAIAYPAWRRQHGDNGESLGEAAE